MHGRSVLALVAATAFVLSILVFLVTQFVPGSAADAAAATMRIFIVGSGGILAATCVVALHSALMQHVEGDCDPRPLVSVHPRRRG